MANTSPSQSNAVSLADSELFFNPKDAELLCKLCDEMPLELPRGRYYLKLEGNEAHIEGIGQGIRNFNFWDPNQGGDQEWHKEGYKLSYKSSSIRKIKGIVLHVQPGSGDPASGTLDAVSANDIPVLPLIEEYKRLSSSNNPNNLGRMTELLEKIQDHYKNNTKRSPGRRQGSEPAPASRTSSRSASRQSRSSTSNPVPASFTPPPPAQSTPARSTFRSG